jgi:RNA polymerase sigma-70 factor (ECF subfamily)
LKASEVEISAKTFEIKVPDRNAFIALVYERYGKKLYSYAIVTWKLNEDAAWELVYKTVYKVGESYERYTFASEEKFASFVFKIFINYLRNHYRDNKTKPQEINLDNNTNFNEDPAPEENRPLSAKMKALNEVLDELEDWQRMLLLMRSEGRSYDEISGYVDKPEDQLKVYYQRLKALITKKINERS